MPKKTKITGSELIRRHQGEESVVIESVPLEPVEPPRIQTAAVDQSAGTAEPTDTPEQAAEEPAPPATEQDEPVTSPQADESEQAESAEEATVEDATVVDEVKEQAPPDGQPGQFWDPTGAPILPAGWTTRALEPILNAERRGETRIRGSILLPPDVYDACFDWILAAKQEGNRRTFNHVSELAFEMIPPDEAGLRRLLSEVPVRYFAPSTTRSHIATLFPETDKQTRALPFRLKKLGFRQHTRLVHTALVARALADLTGWTWPEQD